MYVGQADTILIWPTSSRADARAARQAQQGIAKSHPAVIPCPAPDSTTTTPPPHFPCLPSLARFSYCSVLRPVLSVNRNNLCL